MPRILDLPSTACRELRQRSMPRSVTSEQEWVAPVAAAVCSRGVQGPDLKADAISSTTLDIFLALVATAAAAVSVWRSVLAGRQATEARKSRELTAVISLFNAYESEGDSRIRRLIRRGELGDRLDDPEIRVHLRHYINELNFIAILRARGLLNDELVRDLFYESARSCWEQCAKSFVREIRATQNDDFARELQEWIGAPDP